MNITRHTTHRERDGVEEQNEEYLSKVHTISMDCGCTWSSSDQELPSWHAHWKWGRGPPLRNGSISSDNVLLWMNVDWRGGNKATLSVGDVSPSESGHAGENTRGVTPPVSSKTRVSVFCRSRVGVDLFANKCGNWCRNRIPIWVKGDFNVLLIGRWWCQKIKETKEGNKILKCLWVIVIIFN